MASIGTAMASLFVVFSAQAERPAADVPALPRTGATVESFVPKGWSIIGQADGDLNGDKLADSVAVISLGSNEQIETNTPRVLLILLAGDNGFTLSDSSTTSVLGAGEGGVMGDPFDQINIERGTFVISHYGGSRQRWGLQHRFRLQKNEWVLIGQTDFVLDSHTGIYDEKDENLVTGDVIKSHREGEAKATAVSSKKKPNPVKLSAFVVSA